MISYEINPSSGHVVVDRVLDIRPVDFDERGSYKLPDGLKGHNFIWQIGIVPRHDRAYVYIQPRGIYLPDFRYGPMAGRISICKGLAELPGDYDKFPDLPRRKETFTREISQDGMPYVEQAVFDVLNSYKVKYCQTNEQGVDEIISNQAFREALTSVFECLGFGVNIPVPVGQ